MYRRADKLTSSTYLVRMLLVPAIGVPLAYLIVDALAHRPPAAGAPRHGGARRHRRAAAAAPRLSCFLWSRTGYPHRILVLGTGPEARLVEASLSAANLPGMNLVGFFALDKVQRHGRRRRSA